MKVSSYKDLIVWQKSITLVEEVYRLTKKLPREELFNLTSQMRRAAISIPSNIAEGYGRRGTAEYKHFLGIAKASATELETQLFITERLYPLVETHNSHEILQEILKMLTVFIRNLGLNAKR